MPETAKQSQNQINVASYGALTGDGQGEPARPHFDLRNKTPPKVSVDAGGGEL